MSYPEQRINEEEEYAVPLRDKHIPCGGGIIPIEHIAIEKLRISKKFIQSQAA